MKPLLELYDLKKDFPVPTGLFGLGRRSVHAVDKVSFAMAPGETLSIVGESGCGKSTLARMILRLTRPSSGEVWLDGWRIDTMPAPQLRRLRRRMQAIFQDPLDSLDPNMRVRDIIAEPLINFGIVRGRRAVDDVVAALLAKVGLPQSCVSRFPHEVSGGQRQRIGIARALAPSPDLIVCDEAVSALDVSVKAQIVNLLSDLQRELGMALLFISHDLGIVEHLSDRVAVMYLGAIVEIADCASLFARPAHPYTRALLDSAPASDPADRGRAPRLLGDPPSPMDVPSGCRFHTRCPHAFARCTSEAPVLRPFGPTQWAACHLDEGQDEARSLLF
jgi:peptide/nickel transport system ATP-binding protein